MRTRLPAENTDEDQHALRKAADEEWASDMRKKAQYSGCRPDTSADLAQTEIALFPLEVDTTDDFTDALTGTTAIPLKRRFTQNQGITDHLSTVLSHRVTKRPQVDEKVVF